MAGRITENGTKFLSTLSLRRATLRVVDGSKSSIISILALLAESDSGVDSSSICSSISILALLAESDILLPVSILIDAHFYPRSPCGERQRAEHHANSQQEISILALLAESDVSRVS